MSKTKPCMHCHATITFVRLDTGKPIPVDPIPYPDRGNVIAKRNGRGDLVGYVLSREKPLLVGYERYMPHFKTCKPDRPKVTRTERHPNLFDGE